ncbi:MAG: ATP-binding protein, partial [Chloroflexota bacterium]|nr:ATP-binding protein [Chloroflexota bacterium]
MMSEKIDKTLKKIPPRTSADTPGEVSLATSEAKIDSGAAKPQDYLLGDPDCEVCHGTGYYRVDLPVGHPQFGKLHVCSCRQRQLDRFAYRKLFSLSQLDELSHLTFDNFNPRGKSEYSDFIAKSVEAAYQKSQKYARSLRGWLLLQGKYGCGKTHLAAAIANFVVEMRLPTLFATVPDLLDLLRFSYNDPDTTFEQRFSNFRSVELLVLDDFGTENATPWAREKLFQILNYRYINKLPLVITTNLDLDEIDARIRSRLQDEKFVEHVRILAPDYRLKKSETSTPALSALEWLSDKTFGNFELRNDEIGQEARVKTTMERAGRKGGKGKETIITVTKITSEDTKSLENAFQAAVKFAEKPEGWLVFIGQSGCGKTHLAAAVGNYRL